MYQSTYESGLDDKRRMTIPAAFRAVLRDKSHDGVLIWKSFRGAYLEGAGTVSYTHLTLPTKRIV